MIKGTIEYHDGKRTAVTIGLGEDVKAPRDLAALEKSGWVIDDNVTTAYKAYLAGKRQGDISTETRFEAWIETVAEVDLKPSTKQIEQAVIIGTMDREQADKLLALYEAESGEAEAPPVL